MRLPFTDSQFLDVFAAYNGRFAPIEALLWLASAIVLVQLVRRRARGAVVNGVLALHWGWSGVVYHAAYFSAINRAAWLFGALFVVQAVLFGRAAWADEPFVPAPRRSLAWAAGVLLQAVALLYPVLVIASGHEWPGMPAFAVPCPTALFTIGVMITARHAWPRSRAIVPILWAGVGGSAAVVLGMTPDLLLFIAGGLLLLLALPDRRHARRASTARPDRTAASSTASARASGS